MINTREKELEALCEKLNFTYVGSSNQAEIINNKKVQRYVKFICNAHQKYGIQEKALINLKRLKKPCAYCNHSMLRETFKDEMADINPNIEILSDYVDWYTKIKCRCKIDGYEWEGRASVLLYGGGCEVCGRKKRWDSRGRKTTDDIKEEMHLINPNIEIIGDYQGTHKLIKCKCRIDGAIWESYVCNLLNKSATCPTCALNHVRAVEALSVEEVQKRISENGLNIEVLGEYKNSKEHIKCRCRLHDCIYTVSPRTLLYNKSSGCPLCTQSLGEMKMINILQDMGYSISTQHTFPDCKHIKVLRFDGYCEDINTAFEYQGQQHYYPVDFSGKDADYARQQFDLGQTRDNIKRDYCKQHDIRLIEVPYWEFDNMELFLHNSLN